MRGATSGRPVWPSETRVITPAIIVAKQPMVSACSHLAPMAAPVSCPMPFSVSASTRKP